MKKIHYEKNDILINSDENILFEELQEMSREQFEEWIVRLRKKIVEIWDEYNYPPRTGKTEADIIDQFNKMESYPVHTFEHTDELSDVENDVVINKSRVGVEVDQWFPTMYKTRINYTAGDTGYSIYDLFSDDKHLNRMIKGGWRHFKKDSMYKHALTCIKNDKKYSIIDTDSGKEWVEQFFLHQNDIFQNRDFILDRLQINSKSTSYFQIQESSILALTANEVRELIDNNTLSFRHYSFIDADNLSDEYIYTIRMYEKGHRIFPRCYAAFRIGYIQPAVNFPPLTAKYLYERYTEHLVGKQDPIVIYDPSSGWGGRILGAMSVKDNRKIHYIGTDPNTDLFYEEEDGTIVSRHENLANFYNSKTYRGNPFFSSQNTYKVFCKGSEELQHEPEFQRFRGEVDLIFTSPPYFNREAYSEDETQSYKKYGSSYELWRDGFLYPTLKTCYEWLKDDRYLLWNIADVKIGSEYLPLEADSIHILESFGMKYLYTLKMALENMPGKNRIGEDGLPTCKNFCKVNGRFLKYEPVLVFKKG